MSENHKKNNIKIGLLWHSLSSDNLGVGALTFSQIAICKEVANEEGINLEFIVFGTAGKSTYIQQNDSIKLGSRVSIKEMLLGKSEFLQEVKQCDLVLDIGEGDSFSDIYGIKRLLFLLVSKWAVIINKIPLILSPQTIGPFEGLLAKKLAVAVMNKSSYIFSRDEMSASYLEKLNVKSACSEAIDLAFKLPFSTNVDSVDVGVIKVGVNVSGLLYSGGYSGENQFNLTIDYKLLISDLLNYWHDQPNVEVWLIPHVLSDDFPREDDRAAIDKITQEFDFVKKAPNFKNPSEAKTFIAQMDFVTGARMHACIAAYSAGVPVVPLAYSRKFNGLFNSLQYEWVADGRGMTTYEAKEMIISGYHHRLELRELIKAGNLYAQGKIQDYKNVLRSYFRNIIDG